MGGLLVNGSFDLAQADLPKGWAKFGGTLTVASASGRGGIARFESTTSSTKSVHQVVRIEGDAWYAGRVWVRFASGAGEAFIRISWYASSDGSGRALSTDSGDTTGASLWTELSIGSVQAPATARSARFRLMLRPSGNVTVLFDDASMVAAQDPAAIETSTPDTTGSATPSPTATSRPAASPVADASEPQVAKQPPATLRLSEILPDPVEAGNDAAYEWVELVNIGSEPVNTSGWRIGDEQSSDAIPAAVVAPGAYLIVAGASATVPDGVPVVRVADGRIGNGLNNLAETLTLSAPDGSPVDQMAYGGGSGVEPPGPGRTIGVATASGEGGLSAAWKLTSRATPGFPNDFPTEQVNEPVAAPTEGSTSGEPEATTSTDVQPGTGTEDDGPAVTERKKGSIIPWFILIAAVGGGLGGFAVRYGPALARLKDRLTKRA